MFFNLRIYNRMMQWVVRFPYRIIVVAALKPRILDTPVIFCSVFLLASTEAVVLNETYWNHSRYLKGTANQKVLPPLGGRVSELARLILQPQNRGQSHIQPCYCTLIDTKATFWSIGSAMGIVEILTIEIFTASLASYSFTCLMHVEFAI